MTDVAAAFDEVPGFDRRVFFLADSRRIARAIRVITNVLVSGVAAVAAIGLFGTMVTLAAAWILNTAIGSNPQLRAQTPMGPGALVLVPAGQSPSHAAAVTFEAKWARMAASLPAMPLMPTSPMELQAKHEVTDTNGLTQIAKLTPAAALVSGPERALPLPPKRPPERAESVPLPRPAPHAIARSPAAQAPPQVAAAVPPPAPAVATPVKPQQEANNKATALPAPDSRTAVYDISARTVYLPNGGRLEAHSGLGDKMDDPRYVKVRMRGPTPPNVYNLTLREELFHGVRAIRLNPVDDDKMFGRAGMLAHTYMLGPNGQSNGCVSFRDYDKFLHAFLKGEVERLVVVSHLDSPPSRVAHEQRGYAERYASNY